MLSGAFISACLAMKLLGPGTIYLGQTLNFRLPVKIGDTVTVTMEVVEKHERRKRLTIDCKVRNQDNKVVVTGTSEVMAPVERSGSRRCALVFGSDKLPGVEVHQFEQHLGRRTAGIAAKNHHIGLVIVEGHRSDTEHPHLGIVLCAEDLY